MGAFAKVWTIDKVSAYNAAAKPPAISEPIAHRKIVGGAEDAEVASAAELRGLELEFGLVKSAIAILDFRF